MHFLEGLFRFTVNISGVSPPHHSAAFGKAALLNSYAGWGATLQPRPTFETRKALIRLTKSKIWSLIEKVGKSLSEGFRSPRRNKLRYTQYNQRLNCCTLRYCSLIEKNPEIFFEEEKQRKLTELSF